VEISKKFVDPRKNLVKKVCDSGRNCSKGQGLRKWPKGGNDLIKFLGPPSCQPEIQGEKVQKRKGERRRGNTPRFERGGQTNLGIEGSRGKGFWGKSFDFTQDSSHDAPRFKNGRDENMGGGFARRSHR